jgi:hypothetical protein
MFWRPKGRLLKKVANNWGNYPLANEFAANIDVTDMGANCEGGEQTSLNERMRLVSDNVTILAGSRLALVRKIVDHDNILALKRRGQALFDIGQELGRQKLWSSNALATRDRSSARRAGNGRKAATSWYWRRSRR